jgi:hypothetical protein
MDGDTIGLSKGVILQGLNSSAPVGGGDMVRTDADGDIIDDAESPEALDASE